MVADYRGARAAVERALAIDEKAFGPDHPNVATVINSLGSVLRDLGDLPGTRTAFERALAIDEKAFGAEHPRVVQLRAWPIGASCGQSPSIRRHIIPL